MYNIKDLLLQMVQRKASDLHLTVGAPPSYRIDGEIVKTTMEKLTAEGCQQLVYSLLNDEQKRRFEAQKELDLSFGIKGVGRIRMNVFMQRGSVCAALRSLPSRFMTFEELGLPPVVSELIRAPRGLILVTGPTGVGKTTTLASLIDHLNENSHYHIMTVEDPIEFLHFHKKSVVNQREIGHDTDTYASALKYILRQDPDVILVGEMRDPETISAALTIAETGHLILSTLHTNDAAAAINRILDSFPPHQQDQARSQLSLSLIAVISQTLLPHASGAGRVLACEILVATPAVRSLIRERKVEQIYLSMQTGAKFGMQTMNQSLLDLCIRRMITKETALETSTDPEDLRRMLSRASLLS